MQLLNMGIPERTPGVSDKHRVATWHLKCMFLLRGSSSARVFPRRSGAFILLSIAVCTPLHPQTTPTQSPSQTPRTAPQVQQLLPFYDGQTVSSVELAGRPDVDIQGLLPLLQQRAGQPFAQVRIDASIAALKGTGQFEDVQLEVRPEAGGVRVLFVLQPAFYFGIYEFPGAKSLSYARLLQVTNYPPRSEYTQSDVERARTGLETYLRRIGYFRAEVRSGLEIHRQDGLVDVLFHVTLNPRAKFGDVDITGTTPQEGQRLESVLHSTMARLRLSAIRPGKTYKLKTLQNATRYLESRLNKQGFLAAKVRLVGANYNPETNRADITFNVQTGPVVRAKIEGAHVWRWTEHKLLPIYQQVGVDQELIQEGRQNLVSQFQSKGYFDAEVDVQVEQQPGGELIVYRVTKGPRHKVAAVGVAGNEHIPQKQLKPGIAVEKARLFFTHGKYSQKLVRASAKNLENIYKADGFSGVKITPEVATQTGNLLVTFRVNEGQQDIVETLRIEGNQSLSESQMAPKGLKLVAGQPYSQNAANQDRNQILASYLNKGYLTATFRETAHQLPGQPHRIEVIYTINEGPRVETATVVTLGRQESQQKLINKNTREIAKGKPLTENDMLTSESRLYTLGVFDWAEVDPRRRVTTQTQEDVIIKLHESNRNLITYGFGFEVINRGGSVPSGTVAVPGLPPIGLPSAFRTSEKTFYGPRGTLQYTRKDLWGKADSLSFSGLAGRLDQRGAVTFTDPSFRWTKWSSNLALSGEHNSENPIFTSRLGQASWQLQRPLNAEKTQNFFLRYTFSETGLTRLLIPGLVPDSDLHVRLSTFSGLYIRDTRDNVLDAHKGIHESFELAFNSSALGSSVNFAKLMAQTAYYKKIPKNIIWANSVRIGLAKAFSDSHVPLSEEFFSGGGSTLRGFPLNGAGPQRPLPVCGNPAVPATCSLITVPVGGDQLLIVNSELRYPLDFIKKNLGFATFYDGGNVFRTIGFHGQYTNSVGGGVRYATPLGPVRIDLGHNLNASPGIKATQIFVTLGQAF
jgi:outer membrane protein insertion porin family